MEKLFDLNLEKVNMRHEWALNQVPYLSERHHISELEAMRAAEIAYDWENNFSRLQVADNDSNYNLRRKLVVSLKQVSDYDLVQSENEICAVGSAFGLRKLETTNQAQLLIQGLIDNEFDAWAFREAKKFTNKRHQSIRSLGAESVYYT